MNTKRWRLALIGAGEVGQKHLRALSSLSARVEVVAVVDPDPEQRARVAEDFNLSTFADLDALGDAPHLNDEAVEVALIASPSHLHADQAIRLAGWGVHAIVEKPLALSYEDARRVQEAFERAGRRFFVAHQLRAGRAWGEAREIIDSGALGDVHTLAAQVFLSRDPRYYEASPWRARAVQGGDVLYNQAIHALDLLVWWMGRPDEVTIMRDQPDDTPCAARSAAMIMRWGSAIGTIHTTTRSMAQDAALQVRVLGTRGDVLASDGVLTYRSAASPETIVSDRGQDLRARWLSRVFDALETGAHDPITSVAPSMIVLELLDQGRAHG